MAIATKEQVLDQLGGLVEKERELEKLLERASRCPLDPREVAYLWTLATQCRDHARIVSRHRREIERDAENVPYPRWPRGQGPTPEEALEAAPEVSRDLAADYRTSTSLTDNIYLRKFLAILAEEHDRRVIELNGLADGARIVDDIEEFPEE
jgi:hypothetical protein